MKTKFQFGDRGISLVEVLVGVALIGVVGIFVSITVTQFAQIRNNILTDTNKVYLTEEGYEIIRLLRDENWTNISSLSLNTPYYLQVSTTTLAIGGSSELIEGRYNRSFLVQSIYRNGSGNIVASTTSGSTIDNDARELSVYVRDVNGTNTIKAVLVNLP